MRNNSLEHRTVETVANKIPEARAYLREARIDSTSRMFLRDAAAAASVVPDELLAQIEARLRREARRAAVRPAEVVQPAEVAHEFMLV